MICGRTSGSATTPVRSTWRSACLADAAGDGSSFRATASTCSCCPTRPPCRDRVLPDVFAASASNEAVSCGRPALDLWRGWWSGAGREARRPSTRARGVASPGAVSETARTGQRRVPAGAPGAGARRAVARVVRGASRRRVRRGPGRAARSRIPRRTTAPGGCGRAESSGARGAAGNRSAARSHARRSRV